MLFSALGNTVVKISYFPNLKLRLTLQMYI